MCAEGLVADGILYRQGADRWTLRLHPLSFWVWDFRVP